MKAAWIQRLHTADGRVYEVDTVRVRESPYVRIQSDLYSVTDAQHIHSCTDTDVARAQHSIRQVVERRSPVASTLSLSLHKYEPADVSVLFAVARDYIAQWYSKIPATIAAPSVSAELADIGAALTAVNPHVLQRVANTEVVQGYQQLRIAVERLSDIVVWELRQQRAVLLDPSIHVRRSYTRSILGVVAALETVKHLQPHYALRPASEGLARTPPSSTAVIDMFAWQRSRRGQG